MSEIRKRFWSTLTRWRRPYKASLAASPSSPDPVASLADSLGLSLSDLSALRRLSSLPEWASYLGLLERLYERHADRLKKGLAYDDYRQEVGALTAFQEMAEAADRVALKVEEFDDRSRAAKQRAGASKPDARRVLADSHWAEPSGL